MLRLPAFRYRVPRSVAEAVRIRAAGGPAAMYVAGGTDLYPNMKRRHQEPEEVIAIGHLSELRGIERLGDGRIRVGPGETLTDLCAHPLVAEGCPALAHAAGVVSTPILRNMGTIGGNLCLDTRCNYYNQTYEWRKAIHFCMKKDGDICWVAPSSPRCWAVSSSDTAPVAVAIGAEIELAGPDGTRSISAEGLYRDDGIDYLAKRPDELVTAITLPAPNGWASSYVKLARRGAFDFPVLGVAAWLRRASPESPVTEARIVLGGVGSRPEPVPEAAAPLVGKPLSEETIRAAADAAGKPPRPLDNTDLDFTWRKRMVGPYVERALRRLIPA